MRYLILLVSLIAVSCTHLPTSRAPDSDGSVKPEFYFLNRLNGFSERERAKLSDVKHSTQLRMHANVAARSVLILHGLHESPFYMNSFTNYFESKGYNVVSLLLPGHQNAETKAIDHVQFQEWIDAAETAFLAATEIGQETEILGYSVGGTLATYLALKHPDRVKRLYLLAPALALSKKVLVSSYLLSKLNMNSQTLCKDEGHQGTFCHLMMMSDEQIKIMVQNGIVSSPAAGMEVAKLIQYIEKTFPTTPAVGVTNPLMATYLQVHVPLLMVNSASDNVINLKFNQEFITQYAGPKEIVLFPKELHISHIALNKSREDAFRYPFEIYNASYSEILEKIDRVQGL